MEERAHSTESMSRAASSAAPLAMCVPLASICVEYQAPVTQARFRAAYRRGAQAFAFAAARHGVNHGIVAENGHVVNAQPRIVRGFDVTHRPMELTREERASLPITTVVPIALRSSAYEHPNCSKELASIVVGISSLVSHPQPQAQRHHHQHHHRAQQQQQQQQQQPGRLAGRGRMAAGGGSSLASSVGTLCTAPCTVVVTARCCHEADAAVKELPDRFGRLVPKVPRLKLTRLPNLVRIGSNAFCDHSHVEHVEVENLPQLTSIGDNFAYWMESLKSVHFSGSMPSMRDVGERLIAVCPRLVDVSFTAFSAADGLQKMPSYLLHSCEMLQRVDVTPFSRAVTIGDIVLTSASSLMAIDLTAFESAQAIGVSFLHGSRRLTSIDLCALHNVTSIGGHFLDGCEGLSTVDLSPLSKIDRIHESFLAGCNSLTSLDLTPLSKVTRISSSFLKECRDLKTVTFAPLTAITSVGEHFMRSCASLVSVDVNPLARIRLAPFGFFYECDSLREVDLTPLTSLRQIGDHFFSGCSHLETVKLPVLRRPLAGVGEFFFANCSRLRAIDLSILRGIPNPPGAARRSLLHGCSALTSIDLTPLAGITVVPINFLSECRALQRVDLRPLASVTTINEGFLAACEALEAVDLSPLVDIRGSIGAAFLAGCSSLKQIKMPRVVDDLDDLLVDHVAASLAGSRGSTPSPTSSAPPSSIEPANLHTLSDADDADDHHTPLGGPAFSPTLPRAIPPWSVTEIQDYFLVGCTSVEELDLRPLLNVRSIGGFFCARCASLESVNLGALEGVDALDSRGFFAGCTKLPPAVQERVDAWVADHVAASTPGSS